MTSPILIIGAGPVGLSLATGLARQGIACHIFERGPQIVPEIRASTFHPATMEKMSEWGVIDRVLKLGHKVNRLQFWDRTTGQIVGDFDYKHIACDTPYPFRLQCPQHVYAEALLHTLKENPLVEVSFEHEFIAAQENPDGINAQFKTPHGHKTFSGNLLCGADGANSALRRYLRLEFDGMTYEDRFLLVGTDFDLSPYYPQMAPVSYIFDPEEWVITLQLHGLLRIVFQVHDDQDGDLELEEERIRNRVWKFLGEKKDFPILHKSIYRVHQRVAHTFRVGRSILLGDAAHINNPASGMGMNSGILDAALLTEMIARYLNTNADRWLDHYSENRRQYALDNIRNYTKQRYRDLSEKNPEMCQLRNHHYQEISSDMEKSRAFLLKASMLENRI
jgi:3-(3-hydroxy-phenyl)propionate hydroxylase